MSAERSIRFTLSARTEMEANDRRRAEPVKRIIFVTGTGTGAGKTVLTALLVHFLRGQGRDALGMKPFCCGSRADARLLHKLQDGCLTLDEINPFYFDKPLAPRVAARGKGQKVSLAAAAARIGGLAGRCDVLVVEGVGGLMTPLGEGYTVRELIAALNCRTVIVSPNRLGAINDTILTVDALQAVGVKEIAIVMMGVRKPDISVKSNARVIGEMAPGVPVFCLPYLGNGASTAGGVKKKANFFKKTLARLSGDDSLGTVLSQNRGD